jgi:hypothetical protein
MLHKIPEMLQVINCMSIKNINVFEGGLQTLLFSSQITLIRAGVMEKKVKLMGRAKLPKRD